MLIPGAQTVTPPVETVKVNGKDQPAKVQVPAQQAKAEALLEGLMKQLAAVTAERDAAVAAAKSGKRVRKVELRVSAKQAISAYGLGRWPVTLYAEQWHDLICAICNLTDEQYWQTVIGKFTIEHRHELSTKSEE